ncbi:hypothetical protein [Halobiforma nitratireducens]|uniref:Beta-ketoadipyl CoA thiolase n=1 Tax=Halobiforma nitratireducens JCM 10879 TaxID=1227454 RepID=M0LAH7_9EURY|nr:hypothetical protein [Halobiforma nitratireducens]EMA30552.1 beta-ketoadipyl CoA thiolase [Halobiforma nitratireducens JCM 10879]
MGTELIVLGTAVVAVGIALLVGARHVYPRLDLPDDALGSIRLLTALIAGLLLATGLGLVAVGFAT